MRTAVKRGRKTTSKTKAKAKTRGATSKAKPKTKSRKHPWKVLARYQSQSSPGLKHEVRRGGDGVVYCTCLGWKMARRRNGEPKARNCWHLQDYRGY